MPEEYKRVAIVTGATSGIGEATMRKFVSAGYGVVGNGRNGGKLEKLQEEIGPPFCSVTGDAADHAVIDKLFQLAKERFGKEADIVVANAGRGLGGSVRDSDFEQFEALMKVNVNGVLAIIQKASQRMVEIQEKAFPESAADIVMLGSVVGRHISPFSAVYGASKFAVHALAEGLRRDVGPKGVRVSLIEPGAVVTGFQAAAGYTDDLVKKFHDDFGPLLVAEDIADAIYHVVSQPPHIHIGDIVIRPTRQGYP